LNGEVGESKVLDPVHEPPTQDGGEKKWEWGVCCATRKDRDTSTGTWACPTPDGNSSPKPCGGHGDRANSGAFAIGAKDGGEGYGDEGRQEKKSKEIKGAISESE